MRFPSPSQDDIHAAIRDLNGTLIAQYAVSVHQHTADLDQDIPSLIEAASDAARDLAKHRQIIKTAGGTPERYERERDLMTRAFDTERDLEMRRAAVKAGDRNLQLLKKVLDQLKPV